MKRVSVGLATLLVLAVADRSAVGARSAPSVAAVDVQATQQSQAEQAEKVLRQQAEAARQRQIEAEKVLRLQAEVARQRQAEAEKVLKLQTVLARQRQAESEDVNVRLELAITDQSGTGAPVKKVITLLLANRGSGRVRSSGAMFRTPTPTNPARAFDVVLNVDANVVQITGERVRTEITVEYAPGGDKEPAMTISADESGVSVSQRGSPLNQSVLVILQSGKPTVIVEAADPVSDRKVTLQATATIIR